MQHFLKKLGVWLSLDTEAAVAAVEYAVIAGIVIGGILVWFVNRSS
jgi:Flp pilus assembly pilin Flp